MINRPLTTEEMQAILDNVEGEAVSENPAVSTVKEHLDVYHVLAHALTSAEKRQHARRIVDAVLALQVKP